MRPASAIAVAVLLAGCRTASEPCIGPSWTAAEASRPLSHDDCVRLASHWAPNRAAWQARLFTAQAALHQACALPNPTFSAGWEDIGLAGTPIQQTFSLAYALEGIFARRNRTIAARDDLDAGEAMILAEWQKLAADVHRTYDTLVAMRAKIALQRDLEAVGERHREVGAKYVASGIAPRIGLDRAEAELAAARADRAKAETQARILELEFAFALGFAKPVPLDLSEPMTAEPAAAPEDLGALLAVAVERRAELKAAAAKYRAEVARLQIATDRLQFLPTLTAGPRTQGGERSAVGSIDVVLPIFDSGEPAEAAQRATLLLAAAEARKAAQGVASDVSRAVERLRSETGYLETYAKDLAARRVGLREQTERLFGSGQAPSEDLIQARRDEVTARLALLDSELAVALARVDLRAATGSLAAR